MERIPARENKEINPFKGSRKRFRIFIEVRCRFRVNLNHQTNSCFATIFTSYMIPVQTRNSFLTEDFLLQSEYAKILYHDYAKDLPIIDYHNHLPPAEIAQNRKFENMSKIW